jgi:hypothetical protein
MNDARALLGQNGDKKAFVKPQRYASMIEVNQEYTLLEVSDVQTPLRKVKQGFEQTRKDFLSTILEKQ